MYTISKTFSFCYGHRLLDDEGKCRNLHGHTAKVTIVLGSETLDDRGMVFHFDNLKNTIGKWITENFDHNILLYKDDPIVDALDSADERLYPLPFNPTAENISKYIFEKCREMNLPVVCVETWESETSKASYEE